MKNWIKALLVGVAVIVLLILSIYLYVEITFNKYFSEYGTIETCCECEGMEMYDICCDCKGTETFLEKIYYIKNISK